MKVPNLTPEDVSNWTETWLIKYECTFNGKAIMHFIRGLLEKYPTFGREKETGLLGALDT